MSKIRIWSRACFAIGPGASRDGKVIDTFYTVPGAFQDMDERYVEDPTFKAAVDSGDIQVMTAKTQVAVDVPHVDIHETLSTDTVETVDEYKERVKTMSAEEVATECEKYGAEFVNSDKLKDNKRRLMEAYKLTISGGSDDEE